MAETEADLVIEGGGLGCLVVAYRAARAGRRVIVVNGSSLANTRLNDAVDTAALARALEGVEPETIRRMRLEPRRSSIVQIVAPEVRVHWWADERRLNAELRRLFHPATAGPALDLLVRASKAYEEALWRPGALIPRGWLFWRFRRHVSTSGFSGLPVGESTGPGALLLRILDLTSTVLSGSSGPGGAGRISCASLLEPGRWAGGNDARRFGDGLADAARSAGATFLDAAVQGYENHGKTVRVELAGKQAGTLLAGALLLGRTEPTGFPQNRSVASSGAFAVSYRIDRNRLEPALGPRTCWWPKVSETDGKPPVAGPIWIERSPVDGSTDRLRLLWSPMAGEQPDVETVQALAVQLGTLSAGFDVQAVAETAKPVPVPALWVAGGGTPSVPKMCIRDRSG